MRLVLTPAGRAHLWLPECGPFLGPFLTKCLLISASVPRLESSMCAPRTPPRLERLHTLAIYWASAETGAAHFHGADHLAHAAAAPISCAGARRCLKLRTPEFLGRTRGAWRTPWTHS